MVIRLACCSDTHGIRPPALDERGIVAWLHGGDVYRGGAALDPAADDWCASRTVPVYAVRGNHDQPDASDFFAQTYDITGKLLRINERLWVAGVGWCTPKYSDLPREHDLAAVCEAVREQAAGRIGAGERVILVSHYPVGMPLFYKRHAPDRGWTYECVRHLVEDLRPMALLQGHIHQWFGRTGTIRHTGGTCLVIMPGDRGGILSVDLDEGEARFEPGKEVPAARPARKSSR